MFSVFSLQIHNYFSFLTVNRQWQNCLQLQGKVLEAEGKHFKELRDSMEIVQATHRWAKSVMLMREAVKL